MKAETSLRLLVLFWLLLIGDKFSRDYCYQFYKRRIVPRDALSLDKVNGALYLSISDI